MYFPQNKEKNEVHVKNSEEEKKKKTEEQPKTEIYSQIHERHNCIDQCAFLSQNKGQFPQEEPPEFHDKCFLTLGSKH